MTPCLRDIQHGRIRTALAERPGAKGDQDGEERGEKYDLVQPGIT